MYKKSISPSHIFCLRLDFLEEKKPEVLSELNNKNINTVDIINNNNSKSITKFSHPKKSIVAIKNCGRKGDLTFQKDIIHLQHNQFKKFNI